MEGADRGSLLRARSSCSMRPSEFSSGTGPSALTSRAVTTEAGVAKGVLHRHFEDFDAFLAGLVEDRMARIGRQSAAALREAAGTGTVVANLTSALTDLFGSVAVAIIPLSSSGMSCGPGCATPGRRCPHPGPEAAAMIAAYLTAERDMGGIAAVADVDTLAPTLIGAGRLLTADRKNAPPEPAAVTKVVSTVIASVLREPHS